MMSRAIIAFIKIPLLAYKRPITSPRDVRAKVTHIFVHHKYLIMVVLGMCNVMTFNVH